ncbi:tyrosine-protein kinase receptor torso-like [Daktulosphaira vitifoliae]|uniref:tyrosine-protein kinase receptor torso-like n=1 Tax=Daktulosphaira vitifoliae TaxID=58002 RepID=UPI0021AA8F57|nr:tyrosine-protein kinase receptor torso-like [Daktulosphaira vitifoliae]XP_050519847.1 tyrosine-protein kinase receptor torso-like [Daktulosphaira vitifoliae]
MLHIHLHNIRDRLRMLVYIRFFSFGMYSLMYLHISYRVAVATIVLITSISNAEQFWKYEEACKRFLIEQEANIEDITNISKNEINIVNQTDKIKTICTEFKLTNVRMVCREFDSITYGWNYDPIAFHTFNGSFGVAVELVSYNNSNKSIHQLKISTQSYVRFDKLEQETYYLARVRLTYNGTLCHLGTIDLDADRTLNNFESLIPVDWLNVSREFNVSEMQSSIDTRLQWKLSSSKNCFYKIICHQNKYNLQYPNVYSIDVADFNELNLSELSYDTEYVVTMQPWYKKKLEMALNGSANRVIMFHTPACWELNLSEACPPGPSTDLSVEETYMSHNRFNVRVSWKGPKINVDYYMVNLSTESKNVSGALTEAYFENVSLNNNYYVSIQAFNEIGAGKEIWEERHRHSSRSSDGKYYLWTIITLLALCTFGVIGKQVYRKKIEAKVQELSAYEMNVLKGLEDVHMLMDEKNIIVSEEQLGSGHFGVVRKGIVKSETTEEYPVAIKSLQGRPSSRDIDMFIGEILLMQKVGKHPNIVSMIGCCVDVNNRCMLIVEYCPLGDLLSYMRKVNIKPWYSNDFGYETTISGIVECNNWQNSNITRPPIVSNNCYLYHKEEEIFLSIEDLLRFASQAANGMTFLEKNRIVHRDLAARNILLSDHHTIKICDFGLSRDVYEQNHYTKSKGGDPLPVKWMAIESLKYRVYTTQSDVWSFGILLWEIMTLGGCPYPSIHSSKLYELLQRGYRMSRPALCSYSLYKIMLECWNPDPNKRPKFGSIKDTIDGIIDEN